MSFRLTPLIKGTAPVIALHRPVLLVGRHIECDVRLDSPKVSRRHCCLAMAYDRVLIRDLGSRNGVRVNGRVVEEARLHFGDELAIGPVLFRLELEPAEKQPASVSNTARPASASAAGGSGTSAQRPQPSSPTTQPSRADHDLDLVPLDDI
jgi:pSer/pThr/pTyr-binding forkhead associated (FHA) protein